MKILEYKCDGCAKALSSSGERYKKDYIKEHLFLDLNNGNSGVIIPIPDERVAHFGGKDHKYKLRLQGYHQFCNTKCFGKFIDKESKSTKRGLLNHGATVGGQR